MECLFLFEICQRSNKNPGVIILECGKNASVSREVSRTVSRTDGGDGQMGREL